MCFWICVSENKLIDHEEWFRKILKVTWNNQYYYMSYTFEKIHFENQLFLYTNSLFLKINSFFKKENALVIYMICFLLHLKNYGAYDYVEEYIKLKPYQTLCKKYNINVSIQKLKTLEFQIFKKVDFKLLSTRVI